MLCKWLPVPGKFKFCFLELSRFFFFPSIFDMGLVESKDSEPTDLEGRLYHKLSGLNDRNLLPHSSGGPDCKIKALAGLVPSVMENLFHARS